MMRIGILADTHDKVERTSLAVRLLVSEGAEALFHCGDLTGPDVVEECAPLPSYYVFGNNDFDVAELRRAMSAIGGTCLAWGDEVVLGGRRIAMTHGDSAKEIRRLAARGPDYLLFGHTHVPADNKEGATRYVNPGALHRAASWTVALLDLATDELRFLDVFDHHRPGNRAGEDVPIW
jgi:putative phosphoesterase